MQKSDVKDFLLNAFGRRIWIVLSVFLSLWYVFLCARHYLQARPLWNDEAAVFQSVEAFETKDFFTKVLINGQNFPRFYLCLIHHISKPFDFSILSLRFFSFVAMISAFFVWMKIARLEFKEEFSRFTYMLLWCSSAALIYYAAELKQYSMDVLVSGIFMLFLYQQRHLQEKVGFKRYGLILVVLPALILFSYTAFFYFLFPLYNLILSAREDKKSVRFIMIYVVSLVLFSFLAYYFDMRLRDVYGYDDYFISFASVGTFFKTLGEGITNLFSRWLVERPRILKKIILSFFVFGFLNMFVSFFAHIKEDKYYLTSMKTIGLVIFAELFLMGCIQRYPFSVPRTSLFFCPVVLFLTLSGIMGLKKIHRYLYRIVFYSFFILLIFIFLQLSYLTLHGRIGFAPLLWWFGS